MKKLMNLIAMACALPLLALAGGDEHGTEAHDKPVKLQSTCPVMGGKINKKLFVDHEGQRVYACCAGCIGKLKADPEKYIKKVEAKGETVARLQTSCPISGKAINKDLFVDHEGQRIYACCKHCLAKVKADPAKFVAKLAAKGEIPHKVEAAPKKGMHMEGSHRHH